MINSKNTKRALLSSVLALILCVAMLVGTTYAWFTDSVTSGKNVIQSGNLDVALYYADSAEKVANNDWTEVTGTTDVFGYNLWEPGYTKVAYFKVVNNGSLALKYQLSADVYAEKQGTNKAGEKFSLSDYLYTEVVDVNATRESILASTTGVKLKNSIAMGSASLLDTNEDDIIGLAIWMPTTVGNEANHNGDVPSIEFGINLVATQEMDESDSFGKDYDKDATYPVVAYGSLPVDTTTTSYQIPLKKADGGKIGSAEIPDAAVADDATNITVTIYESVLDTTVTVTSEQSARTYEIKVDGIKENNTAPIKMQINVGTGLTGVKLYHKDVEVPGATYDPTTGLIKFETTSFSPYTVVFDEVAVEEELNDKNIPTAILTAEPLEDISWTGWGGFNPNDTTQQLECNFQFVAKHDSSNIDDCAYKNWYCDYYVMMDKDVPANSIVLGGNYGGYGWVGFNNPEFVAANQEVPLLGSVMSPSDAEAGSGWTYADVVSFVQLFKCGVARANGTDLAYFKDATFTVMLRITNPENPSEYYNVNTVKYTFGENFAEGTHEILELGK